MTGIFQKRGKAAGPLSGSRISPAHGRSWVVSCCQLHLRWALESPSQSSTRGPAGCALCSLFGFQIYRHRPQQKLHGCDLGI
jgi:hypothetical protein